MRYVIFYGENDGEQAKEWAKELREAKHKTLVVDSLVVQEFDIEGELNGIIFCDNVGKHERKKVEGIYKAVGVEPVFIEDILESYEHDSKENPELANDVSGDERTARIRETPRKKRTVK